MMLLRVCQRYSSTSFTFPQRLQRSPTAILESLNSCVRTEGGNPAYTYMDDPFLIPTSSNEKRQFALSKSSGKKAAQWVIDRHSYAFLHNVAVPSIPSYFPKYAFDEKEFIEPDETTVYKLMSWNKLAKAFEMYRKSLEEEISISDPCKYALFDLLCIHNSDNPAELVPPEENWYRREMIETNQAGQVKRTWVENGAAEQLFEELKLTASPEQRIRLYNSFVSGLFKYNHVEKAMATIDEMKQNEIALDLTAYNYLLRSIGSIKESYDVRWQYINDCLQDMKKNSIRPSLRTFNAILYTLRRCTLFEHNPTYTLSVLNEMQQCGIQPSLGTWAHVIMIFYPNDQIGHETQMLPQIMDTVEKQYAAQGNQLHWRDLDDGEFFFNAMFKATVNCRDVDLAKRIHRFLMTGSNIRFIADGFKEQMYYTNLFRLLFRIDMPEQVMPVWESLVPNIYSPSINVVEEFIEFVATWNIHDYYVRLWSDLLTLGFIDSRQNNRRVLERYLALLTRPDQGTLSSEQIKQYANIARQILKRFPLVPDEEEERPNLDEEQQRRHQLRQQMQPKFEYSGQLLSGLISLLAQGDDYEASWTLYEFYTANRSVLINPLSAGSLMSLVSLSAKENNIDRALAVIELISELNYECFSDALDLLNRNVNLSRQDRQRLRTIQKNSSLESAFNVKLV